DAGALDGGRSIRRRQRAVGALRHDDRVARVGQNGDVRKPGRKRRVDAEHPIVEASRPQVRAQEGAVAVVADPPAEAHLCPGARRRGGLVESLAAGEASDRLPQHRLADRGQAVDAHHEVEVDTADDNDVHGHEAVTRAARKRAAGWSSPRVGAVPMSRSRSVSPSYSDAATPRSRRIGSTWSMKSRVEPGCTSGVRRKDRKSTRLNSSHVKISYA